MIAARGDGISLSTDAERRPTCPQKRPRASRGSTAGPKRARLGWGADKRRARPTNAIGAGLFPPQDITAAELPRRPVWLRHAIGQAPFRLSADDLPVLRSVTMS